MGRNKNQEIASTLYVTDLDGTLLDSSSRVSPESVRLLNRAIRLGANITVATARTPATVVPLLSKVHLSLPAVVMTGAAIWQFQHDRFISPRFMHPATVPLLIDAYRQAGVPLFAYFLDPDSRRLSVYHFGGPLSEAEKMFMEQRSHSPLKVFYVPDSGESSLPAHIDRALLFFSLAPDPAPELLSHTIMSRFPDITPVYYHEGNSALAELEVFDGSTSKAQAIKEVAKIVGATRIVAFGDNMNDLPMLRCADLAVAVGNAVDAVKREADVVIDSHDTDAVARFIIDDMKSAV